MSSSAKTPSSRTMLDRALLTGFGDEILADVEKRVRKKRARRRSVIRRSAAGALFLAALLWTVPYLRSTSTVETLSAHRQMLALQDGSNVELSARTGLRTDFRYGRRTVRLDSGEAYFTVAKDSAHPFRVITPQGTVVVTGTGFNVRLGRDDTVQVTLVEGSVQISSEQKSLGLTPGQQATLGAAAPSVRVLGPEEISAATAWRHGQVVMDGFSLAQVAQRFSEYHGVRIEVAPAIAALRLVGTCSLDDLPQWLEILRATEALQVISDRDRSYRIFPAAP